MSEKYTKARLIKAGSRQVLLSGQSPLVDCRVISEDNFQMYERAMQYIEHSSNDEAKRQVYGKGGSLNEL